MVTINLGDPRMNLERLECSLMSSCSKCMINRLKQIGSVAKMNLDETIKYYVEKAEDCEAIEAEWKEKAIEYRQTANYLIDLKEMKTKKSDRTIGFTSFKDDTSRLKKFLNHFASTKLRGDDDEA